MSGNLCRCAAYPNIVAADPQAKGLMRSLTCGHSCIDRPSASPAHAGARCPRRRRRPVLAGGTTLIDLMKLDVMRPDVVIDINGSAGSPASARSSAAAMACGSARSCEWPTPPSIPTSRRDFPVIAAVARARGEPQLRNMASLAGNVLQRTRCTYFRDVSYAACNKRIPGLRLCGARRRQSHARRTRRQRPLHRDLSRRFRAGPDRARRDGEHRRRRAEAARRSVCGAASAAGRNTPHVETTLRAGRTDRLLSAFRRSPGPGVRCS